jgi:hypothetical protein
LQRLTRRDLLHWHLAGELILEVVETDVVQFSRRRYPTDGPPAR